MSNHYDVIVCGAGPAGSCAAFEAAKGGLRTLVIEKQKLPRYKTCGGGMSAVITKYIPELVPEAFVESTVTHLRHTYGYKDEFIAPLCGPPGDNRFNLLMVQRSIFDNALAEKAAAAGASVADGVAVSSVEPDGLVGMRVTTSTGDTYLSNYVIGADGARSIVAHSAGLRKSKTIAFAVEAEVPYDWGCGDPALQPHIAHLEYSVPRGYGWLFPKKEHLSIGAGCISPTNDGSTAGKSRKIGLTDYVLGYLKSFDIKHDPNELRFRGHAMPLWSGSEPLSAMDGRVLLVGDAAGLINPLSGDGIMYACKSGTMAGQAICAGRSRDWTSIVHGAFARNHDAALRLSRLLYAFPRMTYRLLVKHPKGTLVAARVIAGEMNLDGLLKPSYLLGRIFRHLCNSQRAKTVR